MSTKCQFCQNFHQGEDEDLKQERKERWYWVLGEKPLRATYSAIIQPDGKFGFFCAICAKDGLYALDKSDQSVSNYEILDFTELLTLALCADRSLEIRTKFKKNLKDMKDRKKNQKYKRNTNACEIHKHKHQRCPPECNNRKLSHTMKSNKIILITQ